MARCEKCVGQKFCTCPKTRVKDRPPEKWKSPRRERIRTHNWSPWIRARRDGPPGEWSEPGEYDVKICSRCGRARARKHAE